MTAPSNYQDLPDDLPVPVDDGACDHLPGIAVPPVSLTATLGGLVTLSALSGRSIVFAYPRTGVPGQPLPTGWDAIPGARGCTPEACGFRDLASGIHALGVAAIFGLSAQDTEYQREVRSRLDLPFDLLSDDRLEFTRALRLPTFEVDRMVLIKRLTLVLRDGQVEHVFYPIFPPDRHAEEVITWLRANRLSRLA